MKDITVNKNNFIVLQDNDDWEKDISFEDRWLLFDSPIEIIKTYQLDEVILKLDYIQKKIDNGFWAAGFISYEAAIAFDNSFAAHPPSFLPLIYFGIFEKPLKISSLSQISSQQTYAIKNWLPSININDYEKNISKIKDYIASGDTYQTNFTYNLKTEFSGDSFKLFTTLHNAQRGKCSAYISDNDFIIASASPELFFAQKNDKVICKPMKGTAHRGRYNEEDKEIASALKTTPKECAENVMIVDLIRNDLGRIAKIGTVFVKSLYDVERYETVLQMTSTVVAQTDKTPIEVLSALFPCGSVTGAPKIRTMEIIKELEIEPRGIYTGAIGWISPERNARFNVAIRTVTIDKKNMSAVYGVGGGITWDSDARKEYEETQIKANFLFQNHPEFSLLETMLWSPQKGIFLWDRHLSRLYNSSLYFRFPFNEDKIKEKISEEVYKMISKSNTDKNKIDLPFSIVAQQLWNPQHSIESDIEFLSYSQNQLYKIFVNQHVIRLLLNKNGEIIIEIKPLQQSTKQKWRIGFAVEPVNSQDRFLFHKTTNRKVYETAKSSLTDLDEVILWNEKNEITEGCITNIIIEENNILFTPHKTSGLLAGTLRNYLLDKKIIKEKIIKKEDLKISSKIWLINSVRGCIEAELII